jgi:hypothetical protein
MDIHVILTEIIMGMYPKLGKDTNLYANMREKYPYDHLLDLQNFEKLNPITLDINDSAKHIKNLINVNNFVDRVASLLDRGKIVLGPEDERELRQSIREWRESNTVKDGERINVQINANTVRSNAKL